MSLELRLFQSFEFKPSVL